MEDANQRMHASSMEQNKKSDKKQIDSQTWLFT